MAGSDKNQRFGNRCPRAGAGVSQLRHSGFNYNTIYLSSRP
ncbi:MAG: hypothetical protein ACOC13_01990 [Tangfeifania sp.]